MVAIIEPWGRRDYILGFFGVTISRFPGSVLGQMVLRNVGSPVIVVMVDAYQGREVAEVLNPE